MMSPRRASLFAALPLLLLACSEGSSTPTAAPEKASASAAVASAPSASAAASASAAPSEDALVASAAASAEAAPSASASAAAPAASASASAPKAAKPGASHMPKPANGILAPGAADKLVKVGGTPRVALLDAGAEPRAALAYHFTKGEKQPLTIALDMTMGMKSAAMAMPPMKLPRMAMKLGLTASDVDAKGEAKVDALLDAFTVEPKGASEEAIAKALAPQLAQTKGLTMSYWVAPNGHVHDLDVRLADAPDAAKQALQGMSQSFESMTAPLPDEPIGVGARWEVITRVANGGADLVQDATYTLKARDGDKATLGVEVVQLAARDTVQAPGLPPGVTAKLRTFRSGGKGTTELDTGSMAPASGSLDVTSSMALDVAQPGGAAKESVEVETKMQVGFSRAAASATGK